MRIHRLELTAYGPFPGTITLDFDDLNREGIFLLNGPTGSGKSSILDAICFALYGTTSSGRSDLKSRFAEPQVRPRVILDCTIGSDRYRIDRSPAYERPKKRGQGMITEQAKTLIEKFDAATGSWEPDPAITRHKDAGDFMLSVLGLNAQQFNQVMLLPQGKFQRFLVADSGEREQLLKQLFGTEEFEKVQNLLHEHAKEATAAAEAAQRELEILEKRAERAQEVARADQARQALEKEKAEEGGNAPAGEGSEESSPESENPENGSVVDLPDHLGQVLKELAGLAQKLEEGRDTIAQESEVLAAEHTATAQLIQDWDTYLKLVQEEEALAQEESQIAAHRTRLEEHRVAAELLPLVTAADQAATGYQQATDRVENQLSNSRRLLASARAGLTETALEYDLLDRAQSALDTVLSETVGQQLSEQASTQIDRLTRYQQAEKDIADLVEQEKASAATLKDLTGRRTQLSQTLEESRLKLDQQRQELVDTEQAAAQEEAARALLAKARDRVTAAQRLIEARKQLETASQVSQSAEENRRAASAQADALQRQRFDAAAQILAEALIAGHPCSVCGSTDHPAPANYDQTTQPVTEEALTQARQKRDLAEREAQEALTALTAAQSTLDQLVEQGTPEPEEAQHALVAAQESFTRAQTLVAHRKALAQQMDTIEQEVESNRSQLAELEGRVSGEEAKLQQATDRRQSLESQLAPHRQEAGLAERIAALNRLVRQLPALSAAYSDQEGQAQLQASAWKELSRALEQAGLKDAQQVKAQLLEKSRVSQLEQQISDYRDRTLAVRTRLSNPALEKIGLLHAKGEQAPAADRLSQLTADMAQLNAQRDEMISHITRLAAARAELQEVLGLLEVTLAQSQILLQDAQLKRELAATATAAPGSDNRLRMTLTSYVLAYQLSEVAEAASEHLEKMTHGRYRLEHSDRAEGRNKKSGLALDIFDAWHNARRRPETLSGGETFMASLALALGLADVVQQANGGIDIDTLFVDEGFGSLDDETLEEVMTTIDSLRERGRVIGLISHVAEMKNRINKHIVLTSSPQGSSLVTDTGAA